jgi:hypothetical protein
MITVLRRKPAADGAQARCVMYLREEKLQATSVQPLAAVVDRGVQLLLSAVERRLIHHMVRHSAVETTAAFITV